MPGQAGQGFWEHREEQFLKGQVYHPLTDTRLNRWHCPDQVPKDISSPAPRGSKNLLTILRNPLRQEEHFIYHCLQTDSSSLFSCRSPARSLLDCRLLSRGFNPADHRLAVISSHAQIPYMQLKSFYIHLCYCMIWPFLEKLADKHELPMDSGDGMFHIHELALLFERQLFPSSAVCSAHFHPSKVHKRILGSGCYPGQLLMPFGADIMLKGINLGCSYHLFQSTLINADPGFLHFIYTGTDSSHFTQHAK